METNSQPKKSLRISLDYRLISLILLAVIVAMAVVWKPWTAVNSDDRTVSVSGLATLTDTPDEFVFYPSYEFENADKAKNLADLSAKSDEVTAKLKELGVSDNKIKTDSSGYSFPTYYQPETGETTYSIRFTITVDNKELAQKVQDYLLTTAPTGSVSPQANFSEAKRKELEAKARDQAGKDAREKADQMAKNLGFKVNKVKAVQDGTGFGVMPYAERGVAMDTATSSSSLGLQPGENELNYSISVEYYIR